MKSTIKILVLTICLSIGLGFYSISVAKETEFKVATVDLTKVVANSTKVKLLNKDLEIKKQELQKWIISVEAEIKKQKTQEDKDALAKKYSSEAIKKELAIKNEFMKKSEALDKEIMNAVNKEAKAMGYNLVLTKGLVLYGGDDITDKIIKIVK